MIDNDNDNIDNYKMKNLVDISAMVTQSLNFFDIKEDIDQNSISFIFVEHVIIYSIFSLNK